MASFSDGDFSPLVFYSHLRFGSHHKKEKKKRKENLDILKFSFCLLFLTSPFKIFFVWFCWISFSSSLSLSLSLSTSLKDLKNLLIKIYLKQRKGEREQPW